VEDAGPWFLVLRSGSVRSPGSGGPRSKRTKDHRTSGRTENQAQRTEDPTLYGEPETTLDALKGATTDGTEEAEVAVS
jgi:hypothetical protein